MERLTATYTREFISDWTGFDYGEEFVNADAVRAYFTESNLRRVYAEQGWDEDPYPTDDLVLRTCADFVILNGWHMVGR